MAIEDDVEWFGYSRGVRHMLDLPGLPESGVALKDFLFVDSRDLTLRQWDTKYSLTPFDRKVHHRGDGYQQRLYVETCRGEILIRKYSH